MRGREAITSMRSVAALLLIASAVPAMAFTRQGGRQRRAAAQAMAGAYSSAGGDGFGYGNGAAGGGAAGGGAGAGAGGFVFPDAFGPANFQSALRNYLDQMEAMFAQQQEQAHSAGVGGVGGGGGGAGAAHASLALGERGGFAQAQLYPDAGLNSRIAADLSPPAGGPIGVFSSSSSSSHTDESGKTHTFKQATVGVNDNGNVRVFSVKDP